MQGTQMAMPMPSGSRGDHRYEWVYVTPEVAEQMLALNYDKQRRVSERCVLKYMRDLKDGRWNCDAMPPIRISSDGMLVDGQHRLHAVVRSGVPVNMLVWYGGGTAEELFVYQDGNLSRSAGQFVECKNKNTVMSMCNILRCLESGACLGNALQRKVRQTGSGRNKVAEVVSRSEIVNFAHAHLDALVSASEAAAALKGASYCNQSVSGVLVYLVREMDGNDVIDAYVDDLANIIPSERICAVIQRTITHRYTTAKVRRTSVDNRWLMGTLAYGYEMFGKGKTVGKITKNAWEGAFNRLDARVQEHFAPVELSIVE